MGMDMNSNNKYFAFHGNDPRARIGINFHYPRTLLFLGEAVAIEYRSDKVHGGGDGKKRVYRHEFATPVKLCMDERMKKQLYIIGNRMKVTEAGIEN